MDERDYKAMNAEIKNQTAVEWLFEKLWNTDKDKLTWHPLLETALFMEYRQQEIDLKDVTRLEVFNHANNYLKVGRVLTLYKSDKDFIIIDASLQDQDRTLKIFIS